LRRRGREVVEDIDGRRLGERTSVLHESKAWSLS
jgi:hypothetical protein